MNSQSYYPSPSMEHLLPGHPSEGNVQPTSWMHTIPSYMPWSNPENFAKDPDIMKFTAEPQFLLNSSSSSLLSQVSDFDQKSHFQHQHFLCSQQKRKGNHFDDELPISNKVYISEERMVARMNDLCISNNNIQIPTSSNTNSNDMAVGNVNDRVNQFSKFEELENRLSDAFAEMEEPTIPSQDPIIILAPELRKLQKTDSVLPASILQTLQKPSMELVLWKPPGGIVDSLIKSVTNEKHQDSQINGSNSETKTSLDIDRIIDDKYSLPAGHVPKGLYTSPVQMSSEEETMDIL